MDRDNATWLAELASAGERGSGDFGAQAALSDLRDALVRGLHRALAGRSGVDDAVFDDVAQDALVRILDRLGQFEGRSRFVTWATSIAIHMAMSELRRQRWRDVSLDALVADADFTPAAIVEPASHAEAERDQNEILDKMHEVIQSQLTDRQRTALVAELRGMPQDEIARHLGSNRNAVYKLTHDARRSLKRGLEAAGYDAAFVQAALAK